MIEASGEAKAVWSHRARTAVCLSAKQHFRDALQDAGLPFTDLALDDPSFDAVSLRERLALDAPKPQTLWVCEPGEWRLEQDIAATAQAAGLRLIWGRHEAELAANPRSALLVRNLARLIEDERRAVREQAKESCRRWTRSDAGLHSNVSLR